MMAFDPLSIFDRIGASLTGEGSIFDTVRRETSLDRLSELLPYRVYDGENDHDLYINANSTGWIIEIVPFLGADDAMINVLTEVFSDSIPDNAHMQISSWASPRVGPILDRWAMARSGTNQMLRKLALHRVDHLRKGAHKSMSNGAPFFLRQFRILISLGLEGHADHETKTHLVALRQNFIQAMRSIGVGARNIDPDALIRHLDDILNPRLAVGKSDCSYDSSQLIDRQIVRPDTYVRVQRDCLEFETISAADRSPFDPAGARGLTEYETTHTEMRAYTVRKFPDRFHQGTMSQAIGHMLNDQLRLPCPTLSSLCICFGEREKGKQTADKNFAHSEQQAGTNFSRWMPEISVKADDWKWVRERLRQGARLIRAGYFICTFSRPEDAATNERAIRSIYRTMDWELARDRFVHMQALSAGLPLTLADGLGSDLNKLNRLEFKVTDSCVQIAPFQGEYLGVSRPDLLLVGRRGVPFFWSPWGNHGEGNHNVSVIGSSGSGKSVLMEELVTGMLGGGARVCVIDDGESFKHMCEALGGRHVKFTLQDDICLNPFSLLDAEKVQEDKDYAADSLSLVRSMIEQMAKGEERANQEERGLIDGAVSQVWSDKGGKACIDDVAEALRELEGIGVSLANALKPYTSAGINGPFFNGDATLDIDSALCVFEMKDLESKPLLRSVVMLALMFIINQAMMRDRNEKIALVIDEAWALLGKGAAGEFIEGFARRCRKYGGALITGTQGVDDYYKTEGALAAFENSDWTILLRMKPEKIAQVEKSDKLSINGYTADVLKSLSVSAGEYSEMMILGPYGSHVGRLVLDKFSVTLFSTDAQVFAQIEDLEAQGLSTDEAVEAIAFNKMPDRGALHAAE